MIDLHSRFRRLLGLLSGCLLLFVRFADLKLSLKYLSNLNLFFVPSHEQKKKVHKKSQIQGKPQNGPDQEDQRYVAQSDQNAHR